MHIWRSDVSAIQEGPCRFAYVKRSCAAPSVLDVRSYLFFGVLFGVQAESFVSCRFHSAEAKTTFSLLAVVAVSAMRSYYAGMLTNPPKKEDEEKD